MVSRLYYDQTTSCARGIFHELGEIFPFLRDFWWFASIFDYCDTYLDIDGDLLRTHVHPPTAQRDLLHILRDTFGNKKNLVLTNFVVTPALGGQNPRWPPSTRYGPANFFPMGDKLKILFSSIGFLDTGNPLKPFKMLCARYFSWIRRNLTFSAVFKHFPSIYHYFDLWITILAATSMFWATTDRMGTFRK